MSQDTNDKPSFTHVMRSIFRLYALTSEYLKWGILRFFGGIASAGIALYSHYVTGQLLDVALSADMKRFIQFAVLIGSVIIARSLINLVNPFTHEWYNIYSGRKLRRIAIEKINNLPINYYENKHTGESISRLVSDIESLQEFYGNSIAGIWSYVPTYFIAGSIVLLGINWKLTLICTALIPLFAFVITKVTLSISTASKKRQKSTTDFNSYLRDFIEGISIYKAFNMHRSHSKKFESACDEVAKESVAISKTRSLSTGLNIIGALVPQILAYAIGGLFVLRDELTIGQLFAFSNILFPFINTFRQINRAWMDMVDQTGRADHLYKLLDETSERNDGGYFVDETGETLVSLQNVRFGYPDTDPIIQNLSFKIKKGKKYALVGASGSGKTTVHKLLCGYYPKYTGRIEVFGHELNTWNLGGLRNAISTVSQDIYLFSDSVMENIRFGNLNAADEDVIAAAKLAYADEFIKTMERGYATQIGERGVRLSGGQRQRIAAARAILKDAPILLLDEPTSALDTKSEHFVQKAIERLEQGKTVLVIAHRLSTIQNSDSIIVIDGGEVVEQGPHEELIRNNGRYTSLYKRQAVDSVQPGEDAAG
ncbi:MAG: ABC transporter ATP-binding protein [Spirochaetales bacterium]|jgi:ATP-binding cassette, subfamily B, bacterial|nr:ABC transporter ATP-binding protein [Spirochaetales bacterium]